MKPPWHTTVILVLLTHSMPSITRGELLRKQIIKFMNKLYGSRVQFVTKVLVHNTQKLHCSGPKCSKQETGKKKNNN